MHYSVLIMSVILASIAVVMNLMVISQNEYRLLKGYGSVMLLLSGMGYITLIIYGDTPSLKALMQLKYFYFASNLGLMMTTVFAVWYITPGYRKKIKQWQVPVLMLPWQLFYLYLMVKRPAELIRSTRFGYQLVLKGSLSFYLGIVRGSFMILIVLLCTGGILRYRHLKIRVQLFFIMAAQILIGIDGISCFLGGAKIFRPFTLTEAFAFLAVYYAYKDPVRLFKQ